ncbi:hypothetical protein NCS55_00610400 [Fusarium keratoplasticum]|nr:hypothetical protein NCS55_00610400 [Fusarium keratoplasticum]
MEVVGGIAAVLQLVQAVGNTVIYVSQVYHDVRDMDDILQDFDSQLDATRMMLSVLSDGIRRSALGQNTPPWWNQSALEGILNSYDRSYSRLGAIFVEIGRQRSSAAALRAYIRKRRYDGDISHLRLSIDTYTSALQLPVLIQTIQGSSTLAVPQPPTEDAAVSFDELTMDLVTRALRRTDTPTPISPQQWRSEDSQAELDAVKQKEKLDMENDTRATLGVLKGLMGHVKDYASSIESPSTSSRLTQPSSKARRGHRDTMRAITSPESRNNIFASPGLDFQVRLPPTKHQDVSDWAGNVYHGDNLSFTSASLDSSLPSVANTTQSALSTSTRGTSLLDELHERRIQAAEKFMKEKMFDKAIPHLERLLSSSSDPEFAQDASRPVRSLAKALVHSQNDDSTVEGYCQRFPSIRAWVDEYRLEHGLSLLGQGNYDQVIVLLQSYKTDSVLSRDRVVSSEGSGNFSAWNIESPEYPINVHQGHQGHQLSPARFAGSKTRQKIQITLFRALLQSYESNDKDEAIPILERLLQWECLDSADKGDALSLLAESYRFKGNFEDAKSHGIQACQIKMDLLGRDHEDTTACITLMANICLDNNDPDEDLWRGTLSQHRPTNGGVYTSPPRFPEVQDRLSSCIQEMQRLATKSPKQAARFGVNYLKENYCPILSQRMSDSELIECRDWTPSPRKCLSDLFFFDESLLCWDCLSKHMETTHTLAGRAVGAACFTHRFGRPSGFTGLSPFHFFAMAVPKPGK